MQTIVALLTLALCIADCAGYFKFTAALTKYCKGTLYLTDQKICCSNRLFMRYLNDGCCGGLPYNSDETACCAALQYDIDSYICCDEKVEPRMSRDSCCGPLPYDSGLADCRDGKVYVRYPLKSWKKQNE